ncbi:MAG: hypothetical protein KKI09_08195 [Spirochaetes bacterium]|nr:hypothetical protein [Spirochaetota bacterium]MBU0955392.1 hypothetical protein [Spirochaetota bacterium]
MTDPAFFGDTIINWLHGLDSLLVLLPAKFLLLLEQPAFYFIILPIMYWCLDRSKALRLAVLGSLGAFLGRSMDLSLSGYFGLPAGVSFLSLYLIAAAAMWLLAMNFFVRRRWQWLGFAMPLILLLAEAVVHGGTLPGLLVSVLAGWGLAAVWLIPGRRFELLLSRLHPRVKISLAALLAFGMNAVLLTETGLPGLFFGAVLGASLLDLRLVFKPAGGTLLQRLLRIPLGFGGLALLYFIGDRLLVLGGDSLYPLVYFIFSTVLAFWCTFAAPWVFVRLLHSDQEKSGFCNTK